MFKIPIKKVTGIKKGQFVVLKDKEYDKRFHGVMFYVVSINALGMSDYVELLTIIDKHDRVMHEGTELDFIILKKSMLKPIIGFWKDDKENLTYEQRDNRLNYVPMRLTRNWMNNRRRANSGITEGIQALLDLPRFQEIPETQSYE